MRLTYVTTTLDLRPHPTVINIYNEGALSSWKMVLGRAYGWTGWAMTHGLGPSHYGRWSLQQLLACLRGVTTIAIAAVGVPPRAFHISL